MLRDSVGQQPPKRRKVAESCKLCRAKKTRCDGLRPVCSPCSQRGATCGYNDATVVVPAVTLSDLDERLRRLEEGRTRGAAFTQAGVGGPSTSTEPDSDPTMPLVDQPLGVFMHEISLLTGTQSTGGNTTTPWAMNSVLATGAANQIAMVIPRRATADNLLACYERYVQPGFSILHMPTFRKTYEQLWAPQRPGDSDGSVVFFATLNMLFALGCLNNAEIEPQRLRLPTASTYYERARALLPLDSLDEPSLEVVQYLLLQTLYLTYTRFHHRCFNILAVAIRVAQSLGFNVDCEAYQNNQLTRERSRRAWYQCITLNRLFSSFARPVTLLEPVSKVPLPAPIDDEYLLEDGEGSQPPGVPSTIDALVATIKIYQVMEVFCKQGLCNSTKPLSLVDLVEVIRLNSELDDIENELPPHLKEVTSAEDSSHSDQVIKVQCYIVKARFLHLRLYMLRPTVLAAAQHYVTRPDMESALSSTETALQTQVLQVCIDAATTAINMIYDNLHSSRRIFSSTAVFVNVSAATAIIAAALIPVLNIDLDDPNGPYKELVPKAFKVLEEHRWQVEGAWGARMQLERFQEMVNRTRRRQGNESQNGKEGEVGVSQRGQDQDSPVVDDLFGDIDLSDPIWSFDWGSVGV